MPHMLRMNERKLRARRALRSMARAVMHDIAKHHISQRFLCVR
jgi:hypothetical protein